MCTFYLYYDVTNYSQKDRMEMGANMRKGKGGYRREKEEPRYIIAVIKSDGSNLLHNSSA